MKILVLGGTVFVGRHFAEAAIAAGHDLTLFHRGSKGPGLVAGTEEIFGDRDGGLAALGDRTWDAVVDTCGYFPRVVAQSTQYLKDRAKQYLFISTISVYNTEGLDRLDEHSPVLTIADPSVEEITGETYGALKALCEQAVIEAFRENACIIRPGLIMGPFDPSNRFTYWVDRFDRGGQVLVPRRLDQPMQLIDARDLAGLMLKCVADGTNGIMNACGPSEPKTFNDLIEACLALNPAAKPVRAHEEVLTKHEIALWQELTLALPSSGESDAMLRTDNSKAIRSGLTFRSWDESARDTLAWRRLQPTDGPFTHGLDPEKEQRALAQLAADHVD